MDKEWTNEQTKVTTLKCNCHFNGRQQRLYQKGWTLGVE